MGLKEYNKKRRFSRTPEPPGITKGEKKIVSMSNKKVFVVQKHRATRLHYDLRLEDELGALKSWAVPKGPSLDPQIKRLAVSVEDHPYDYLLFEGTIPEGNYGAGTVIVWDHGTYDSERKLIDQFNEGKISFDLNGKKLKGHFSLVRTGRENQWLLIKANDKFARPDFDLTDSKPKSVLSGKTNDDLEVSKGSTPQRSRTQLKNVSNIMDKTSQNEKKKEIISSAHDIPRNVRPMLAYPVDEPFDSKEWVYEIKWDGVRAITYIYDDSIRIESRKGNDITKKYPDIYNALEKMEVSKHSTVLDGEIVVLDEKGFPNFQGHQHRMNVSNQREIEVLAKKIPATYYVFDILHLDGKDLRSLSYMERRKLLSEIVFPNDFVKISDYIEGNGSQVLKHTIDFNLEGIVAKRKSSRYREGVRSHDWLKIKNTRTQDCVIIGYTKGEGNRSQGFGSLLLAVYDSGSKEYRFVGHVGTGFNFQSVKEIYAKLQTIRTDRSAVRSIPYKNRETEWVKPILVAEVKFTDWTDEDIMRAPVFLRFRVDKNPEECVLEADQPMPPSSSFVQTKNETSTLSTASNSKGSKTKNSFSNLQKIYWPATRNTKQITKGDLIEYYDSIASLILPHLRDRPLSLSRYPNGIYGKSFYHKDWDQSKPDYVKTAKVYSEHRKEPINYLVCNNVKTLLWIANLGSIEMHPWYSRIKDFEHCKTSSTLYEEKCGLNFPDFIVLDLDPYIYSGKEKAGSEPEYNLRGFRAAAEVAFDLKDVLDELGIKSYVKTSGKTGLHIYIPTIPKFSYDETRSFAELIGKILMSKFPNKITMEWSTPKRKGKVFFDYNQNSRGKTIASAWSVRPTPGATVSVPIDWAALDDCDPAEYSLRTVPGLFKSRTDPWKSVLTDKQDLSKVMTAVKKLA